MTVAMAAIDPALAGRELGAWHMVPSWETVPVAVVVLAALAWYFIRLGRADVPRGRRILRRVSIVFVTGAVVSLVAGLTFIHPHEDRVGFAIAWLAVSVSVIVCAVLAALDVVLTTRQGLYEFRELKQSTLGGKSGGKRGGKSGGKRAERSDG